MTYQLQLTYRIVFYNPRLDMHHDHSLKFILSRIFSRRPLRLIAFVLRAHVPQMSASRPVIILIQNRLRALDGYLIMDKKSLSSSLRLRGKINPEVSYSRHIEGTLRWLNQRTYSITFRSSLFVRQRSRYLSNFSFFSKQPVAVCKIFFIRGHSPEKLPFLI